jgi:hypothetical protein
MIDKDTRLDSSFAIGSESLNYRYTLVNYRTEELDTDVFLQEIEPDLVKSYCTHPDIELLRLNGIAMKYHYYGSDGDFIGSVEARPSKCRTQSD